ncbi:hypothetical protein [Paenibacillus kandeliae]|uniref:hypothetical protein n=1 Tax=Paenibacillus kandeliae TaxID=3231269 RepID=UPI00345A12BE
MDELSKLGDLLELPALEPETIALINTKMREMIKQVVVLTPEQREMLDKQKGNIMDEWINGLKEGDDT